jgi:hypothetical protein
LADVNPVQIRGSKIPLCLFRHSLGTVFSFQSAHSLKTLSLS